MDSLPTDLDTLLEAVEVMMGTSFADVLEVAVIRDRARYWDAGWTDARLVFEP